MAVQVIVYGARLAFLAARDPMVRALFLALKETTAIGKAKAAARILASGLGPRVARAMVASVFQNKGLDAAASIINKVPYSALFERGGTIEGRPLLWLPLSTTPQYIGASRTTPELYAQRYGKLHSVNRIGRAPLLFGKKAGDPTGDDVPLFAGVPRVTIRKRVDVTGAVEEAAAQMPALVEKHLRNEN